jgi:hypothetical protein
MKCREVHFWLLTTKADAPLPCGIRNHLVRCVRCRQEQQLLKRLDAEMDRLPAPPADATARTRLLETIAKIPQLEDRATPNSKIPVTYPVAQPMAQPQPAQAPQPVPQFWQWTSDVRVRAVLLTTAAVLLIAIGWLLGHGLLTTPRGADWAAKRISPPVNLETTQPFVLRLAKHDVQLAAAVDAGDQVQTLNVLAGDLKDEAIRLAQQGALAEVPVLTDLYRRVAEQGVVRRALLLPEEKRAEFVAALVKHFRTTDKQLQTLRGNAMPLVAKLLRPLEDTAREAGDLLEAGKVPPAAMDTEPNGQERPAFVALVHYGLKLAEEVDPLRRAELSAEAANVLAQATVALAASGQTAHADAMGAYLGDLLGRGVASNLDRVESSADKAMFKTEIMKVRQQTAQAIAVLEKNLAGASPAAQAGLEQAIKAATPGRDKVLQPGQEGPGILPGLYDPPSKDDGPGKGKGHTPPGQKKKASKS